ncbi:TPA: hypothetical protein KQB57_001378 [Clostridioides difficile]|uniref:hypothetical protein n=3 Tax=Clostridioides difficile TaxID=1496 RepID=UPI00016C6421|nr:hypothetical protein [Clostridioides difficile]AXU86123.1 hypothetical protein CDIF29745_01285 [Clostridioides difficile]EGT3681780.1 hypothetical protein [Clostridioides difficile]EGT3810267.1 hypothetical protein [Clostridioides difficile]EGT3810352.1 hypothetical protein [Clostridioides difficile]EGT3866310.1 hypothetical protein [Clostridioides difficile]
MLLGDEIKLNLEPSDLINSIPYFKSEYSDLCGLDADFIKEQLLKAENNDRIVSMARGEGRAFVVEPIIKRNNYCKFRNNSYDIFNSIPSYEYAIKIIERYKNHIFNPTEYRNSVMRRVGTYENDIFNWGYKSMHSYMESLPLREFLEPNKVDRTLLFEFLDFMRELFSYQLRTYPGRFDNSKTLDAIETIKNAIIKTESHDDLLIIKEWLCFLLHTGNHRVFKNITPWISLSTGSKRYNIVHKFASRKPFTSYRTISEKHTYNEKEKFIFIDYWEYVDKENLTFRNTNYIVNKLKSMGVNWYENRNNEVMVKYALFPQQIIGYYYFENRKLQYYFINPHYLKAWQKNKDFKIGDELYINQEQVVFPFNNPYRVIYGKKYGHISVVDKR